MKTAIVSGSFDDLRSRDMRFLEEAAKSGSLHVLLWPDKLVKSLTGKDPKFPQEERHYMLHAIRYVDKVTLAADTIAPDTLGEAIRSRPDRWVVDEKNDAPNRRAYCKANDIDYAVVCEQDLQAFPDSDPVVERAPSKAKKVLITGCFDWFHSGHVRFLEEVSEYGELYAVVGNDKNIEFLKGKGHPLFPQEERRFVLQSVRYVKQALISSGMGWLDAEPEIRRIEPDIYAVNEDGDKPEKAEFCKRHGLEYLVLKRLPKQGLARRESTKLRGF